MPKRPNKRPTNPVVAMRIHKPLYRALVKAARISNRSISEEIEFRLERSFLFDMGDKQKDIESAFDRIERKIENLRKPESEKIEAESGRIHNDV